MAIVKNSIEELNTDPINFDITADWTGLASVSDESSFVAFLENQGATNVVVSDFSLIEGRLTCFLYCDVNILELSSIFVTDVNRLGGVNGLTELYLSGNQIVDFNPTLPLPSSLTSLDLNSNQIVDFNPTIALPSSLTSLNLLNNSMTTSGYTASEPWATAQPSFSSTCNISFSGNINSVSGTNLEAILLTKNANVIP